jgi:hypothetical protein
MARPRPSIPDRAARRGKWTGCIKTGCRCPFTVAARRWNLPRAAVFFGVGG